MTDDSRTINPTMAPTPMGRSFDEAKAAEDPEVVARAAEAVRQLRDRLPVVTQVARVMSGDPRVRVIISSQGPCTDGKNIYLRPRPYMGRKIRHDRNLCHNYDEVGRPLCPGCAHREYMDADVVHETAHLAFDSFISASEEDRITATRKALAEARDNGWHPKWLEIIEKRMAQLPPDANYVHITNTISPFLAVIMNCLEDARVNRSMGEVRRGFKRLMRTTSTSIFEEGLVGDDGKVLYWRDAPLNSQAMIGLFCEASGFPYFDWLDDKVVADLQDEQLRSYCARAAAAENVSAIYKLSVFAWQRLQELGYCLTEKDLEEPVIINIVMPGMESEEGDAGEGEGGGDEGDSESGESGEDGDQAGKGQANRAANGEGDDSNDRQGDAGTASGPGAPQEGSEGSEQGSGAGEGDEDQDSDQGGSEGDDESAGAEGDEDGDGDGGDGDDSASASAESDTDDQSNSGDDGHEDGSDPHAIENRGTAEDALKHLRVMGGHDPAQGVGDRAAPQSQDPAAKAEREGEPIPNEEKSQASQPSSNSGGLSTPMGNQADEGANVHAAEDVAIDHLILHEGLWETPSRHILGVNVHRIDGEHVISERGLNVTKMFHEEFADDHYATDRFCMNADDVIDAGLIADATARARRVFRENDQVGIERNRRRGKVDARTLGRRMVTDDDRVFKRRRQPVGRDHGVIIGLDISGSTSGGRIGRIKSAGMHMAEMLHNLGVDFGIYCHSGTAVDIQRNEGYGHLATMNLDIVVSKDVKDPWDDRARGRLAAVTPAWCNLDGHALEWYRKRVEQFDVSDRWILYFTDGSMPYANYVEELEVLQREIDYCEENNIHLLGVGVNTDSPSQHGLDTVRLDSDEDIVLVIEELQARLTVER